MTNKLSKYNIVVCELHYTPLHGKTKTSNPNIESHYLVIDRFDGITGKSLDFCEDDDSTGAAAIIEDDDDDDEDDDYSDDEVSDIITCMEFYGYKYYSLRINNPHLLIRNYHNIISKPDYIKPEIAECIKLPTLETIAIIKTIWIKIIKSKWKNIYKKRHDIYNLRKIPNNLLTRQITGKWPSNCNYLPGLSGMLNNI